MCLQQQVVVQRAALIVCEVDRYARPLAARATALHRVMRGAQRIVEVMRADVKTQTAAHNGDAALELVQGDVHTLAMQDFERALQAMPVDLLRQVAHADAGMAEETGIRALRERQDAALHDAQQALAPAGKVAADGRAHLVAVRRLPGEPGGKRVREAAEQRDLLEQPQP